MKTTIGILGLLLAVGCGVGEVGAGPDGLEGDDDALSTRTPSFVTVQADTRECFAVGCGGFFVTDVNKTTASQYVADLDFSQSGLGAADEAIVRAAPAEALVLHGKLGPKNRKTHQRNFLVFDAYRGLPGITALAGDVFYQVSAQSPAIQCFAAPCNNDKAQKLNSRAYPVPVTTVAVASAALPSVDQSWLIHRVEHGQAIVAARLIKGQKYPAGTEKVLDSSQVFLHIPEAIGPCPIQTEHVIDCAASGEVNVSGRDGDRCMQRLGCAPIQMCPMHVPACAPGYTRSAWTGSSGCAQYVCDPSWVIGDASAS